MENLLLLHADKQEANHSELVLEPESVQNAPMHSVPIGAATWVTTWGCVESEHRCIILCLHIVTLRLRMRS